MTITLNADWLSKATDEDVRWLLARAERYGWEVLVEGMKTREVVKRETY